MSSSSVSKSAPNGPGKTSKLHRLSAMLRPHRRQQKQEVDPHDQEAINKALIKQYGQPPAWAAQSNMHYTRGLKGTPRRMMNGAEGLGAVAGAGGGGG